MRKKISSLLIIFLLTLVLILLIMFSSSVIEAVLVSISIWRDKLFPTIFPFFVLSELMINYGFTRLLNIVFGRFMYYLFYLPGEASFALFGSMISGFPSGSKYIVDLLNSKSISDEDANYLIRFTHFSNPMFIVGGIGYLMLNNIRVGYLILVVHFLTNFIIAFLFRRKRRVSSIVASSPILPNKKKGKNFILVLSNAIINSFKTLILMFGIITCFLIIITIVSNIFSFNSFIDALLKGILEITMGIQVVSNLDISLPLKASIIAALLSFGGFSIHFQVLSIIEGTNIKYKYFLLSRIVHSLIAGILVFIILF